VPGPAGVLTVQSLAISRDAFVREISRIVSEQGGR
jgi:hypothetical protein